MQLPALILLKKLQKMPGGHPRRRKPVNMFLHLLKVGNLLNYYQHEKIKNKGKVIVMYDNNQMRLKNRTSTF
jgi:hypothetical protein